VPADRAPLSKEKRNKAVAVRVPECDCGEPRRAARSSRRTLERGYPPNRFDLSQRRCRHAGCTPPGSIMVVAGDPLPGHGQPATQRSTEVKPNIDV
jgi:hypothetical protein